MKYTIKDALIDFAIFQAGVLLDLLLFHLDAMPATIAVILLTDTIYSVIYVITIRALTQLSNDTHSKLSFIDRLLDKVDTYSKNIKPIDNKVTFSSLAAFLLAIFIIGFSVWFFYYTKNIFTIITIGVVMTRHASRLFKNPPPAS